jgi:hypothetical protein
VCCSLAAALEAHIARLKLRPLAALAFPGVGPSPRAVGDMCWLIGEKRCACRQRGKTQDWVDTCLYSGIQDSGCVLFWSA